MLGRDELVLHAVGFGLGGVEHFGEGRADAGSGAAGGLGLVRELGVDDLFELRGVSTDFFEHGADDAAVFGQQRGEQVDRLDLRIAPLGGELLSAGDGLLGLDG